MAGDDFDSASGTSTRQRALMGLHPEGGAQHNDTPLNNAIPMPENGPAELGALHVRVIALENLVISLLSTASAREIERARKMAGYISPREGFTQHPLTTLAGAHMVDLIERADRFGCDAAS
jgi:hypothetical protein